MGLARAISGVFLLSVALVAALKGIETAVIGASGNVPVQNWPALDGFRNKAPEKAVLQSLLDTIIQVTALFLGLYYTAVSVVVSTSYRDVPSGVRRRILGEQAGSFYVNLVAFTGAVALLIDGLLVVGWNPGWLNLGFLTLCSVASALAFVVLGIRLFDFFDPALIARVCTQNIFKHARSATVVGYRSDDPSFQRWYRTSAEEDLRVLRDVVILAGSVDGRARESLNEAMNHIVLLFTSYSKLISHIPPNSFWFRQKPQHASWFSVSETELSTAIRTSTGLQPKQKPDHFWLERELLECLAIAVRRLLKAGDYDLVAKIANAMLQSIDTLASRLQLDHAMRVSRLLSNFAHYALTASPGSMDGTVNRISAVDVLSIGPMHLVLGFVRAMQSLSPDRVRAFAVRTSKERIGAPMLEPAPSLVREEVDRVRAAVEFERSAEGYTVTPSWYLAHRVGRSYAEAIRNVVPEILSEVEYLFTAVKTKGVPPQNRDVVTIAIERGLETTHKLEYHLSLIEHAYERLRTLERPVDTNDQWPVLEFSPVRERGAAVRESLIAGLAELGVTLNAAVPSGESPDSLGFAYTTLTDACLTALLEQKWALFEQIYGRTLLVQFAVHDRLREESKSYVPEYGRAAIVNVGADIVELAGIALIMAEIQGGSASGSVWATWDAFLASSDAKRVIQSLVTMWEFQRRMSLIVSHPHASERSEWKRNFRRWLEKEGLLQKRGYGSRRGHHVDPRRPMLSAYIRLGSSGSPGDFFVAVYLSTRSEAGEVVLSDSVKKAQREMQRLRDHSDDTADGSEDFDEWDEYDDD